jgi:hypothetical protein
MVVLVKRHGGYPQAIQLLTIDDGGGRNYKKTIA